ncbi:MAG: DPP IV N-terminal domain-containing protein [Thermoanaerobaculales bacterium]
MRRLAVVLCLLSTSILSTAGEPPKRLTLEALFAGDELSSEAPSGLMWLPDGAHILYRSTHEGRETLWREHVLTGEQVMVADWSTLMEELAARRPHRRTPHLKDVNSAASDRFAPALSPDGSTLIGSTMGDLFSLDLATGKARFLTGDAEPEIFPTFSPDGTRLGFVRSGDLWWMELATGVVHRATDRGDADHLLSGVADWVYEEELELGRSFWWSPDGTRLAFLEFDVSPVGVVPIASDSMPYPGLELQRYPKAGTPNPLVRLGVVGLDGGEPVWMDTGIGDSYLPRAGWTPGGEVWVQRLNRDQTVLELMTADPTSGKTRVLLTEEDPAWINVRDDLHFLADGRFLWTSERDGWRHLYLHGADGVMGRRLTSGKWQIEEVYGLDAAEETVFFQANRNDLRQRNLLAVDISTGTIRSLGRDNGGSHAALLGPEGQYLVDTWSRLDTPPRADLVAADGAVVHELWHSGDKLADWDLLPVESGSITADDGTELHSLLVRPRDFDPTKRYPVVLYVYGGPHSQLTRDRWGGSFHNTFRLLADMGIGVFLVDNRGTWGRGHAFETAVHRRLGKIEVADQLTAARWLKRQSWVDGDRIAVYGGSYGGYMTLMCLLTAPDLFRAGIAYAPVTDWRLYDTIYTERYMDTPEDNADGYRASAPLTYAESLASPLLLVHGAMDNNVHLQNTLQLIDRLAKADKTFELMVYPEARHGIRRSQFKLHFHRLKVNFLKRHLLGDE